MQPLTIHNPAKSRNQSRNQSRNLLLLVPTDDNSISGKDLQGSEVWITAKQGRNLLGVSDRSIRKACAAKKYVARVVTGLGGKRYEIALSSLPEEAQMRYRKEVMSGLHGEEKTAVLHADPLDIEELQTLYLHAPEYNRKKYEKYYPFFLSVGYFATRRMPPYGKLKKVLEEWNSVETRPFISLKQAYEMEKKLREQGYSALFGKYGQTRGVHRSIEALPDGLREHLFATFRCNFLSPKGPTQEECRELVLEEADHKGVDRTLVPSSATFVRAIMTELEAEYGVSGPGAIYYARFGEAAYNRKYGNYADRDVSELAAGACWVFDHMQLDMMVRVPDPSGFQLKRFWVTAVADMRSWKVLYFSLSAREPSTEDIKLVYMAAAMIYGVPDVVYLDNGKDFRSLDFSGQSRKIRVQYSEQYLGSVLGMTGVRRVVFAIPYNAKAKIIERIFRKWHERFEKVLHVGYTGSTSVDRVDELAKVIKSGNVLHYEDMAMMLDAYVAVMNGRKMQRKDPATNGMSPDEVFERFGKERPQVDMEVIFRIAGKMSSQRQIGKNGFEDAEVSKIVGYKALYWADWMYAWQGNGRQVYCRRDLEEPRTAWFFSADDHVYLGAASLDAFRTNALAETEEDRTRVAEVIARTRSQQKLIKSAIKTDGGASGLDILMRKGVGSKQLENGSMRVPQERPMQKTGTHGGFQLAPEFADFEELPTDGGFRLEGMDF